VSARPRSDATGLTAAHATPDEADVLAVAVDQVRRFLAREVDADAIDREARIPPATIGAAAQAGLFGLTIPCEHGGAGLSLKATCRVIEELARGDRSVAIMVGLHAGLGSRPLVERGARALKERYLPAMAAGERIAAFAATEAGAGSDLAAVRTTGTIEGDAVRLVGEKSYVTNGGFAGVFTVLARTPGLGGARAWSLVCVPREAPGVTVGPEEHKLGIRGSSTVTVRFDDVRVPRDHLVGEVGRGLDHAHRALAWGRTILSAGCVGTARAALDATVAHVASRRQFGRPIGAFGATQAHVADMAARLYAMESLVRDVGEAEAAGVPIERTSSVAKVFCSEAAFAACDAAVQLHGALGFIEPVGVARLLRDCRITRIFEGANDVLLVRAGVALVTSRDAAPRPLGSRVVGELAGTAEACDALAARLHEAVESARRAYGVRAIHEQVLLQRLARAEVCLAASRAAALRAWASGETRDVLLAERAVDALAREGLRHVEDASRAAGDTGRAAALCRLFYRGEPSRRAGAREEVEA
jgi:alkylation response protein AidB-like acyl-CoA dehydrogenase